MKVTERMKKFFRIELTEGKYGATGDVSYDLEKIRKEKPELFNEISDIPKNKFRVYSVEELINDDDIESGYIGELIPQLYRRFNMYQTLTDRNLDSMTDEEYKKTLRLIKILETNIKFLIKRNNNSVNTIRKLNNQPEILYSGPITLKPNEVLEKMFNVYELNTKIVESKIRIQILKRTKLRKFMTYKGLDTNNLRISEREKELEKLLHIRECLIATIK